MGWLFICSHSQLGKTTVLYVTKFGNGVEILPTIGWNMEIIAVSNISIAAMDEGGRSRIRALQRFRYRGMSELIFVVVDWNDRERIDEARDKLRNKPILIYANKQDLSNSLTFDELRDKLNLTKTQRKYRMAFTDSLCHSKSRSTGRFQMVGKFDGKKIQFNGTHYWHTQQYKNDEKESHAHIKYDQFKSIVE
jgi:GTPase SAR1 family protein